MWWRGTSSLSVAMGKVAKGALLASFYRGESLGVHGAMSRINSPTESKITMWFVADLDQF
jgi:hypothetical protein